MSRLFGIVRRSLLTRWLHLRASVLLVLGRSPAAERELRRIVRLRPSCFRAHLALGRIAFDSGRHLDAVEELAVCHRLDPDRFLRQALPAVLVDEVASRTHALPQSPLFALPPIEAATLPEEWDDLFADGPAELAFEEIEGHADVHGAPPGTDFVSAEEFLRFRDLPPIGSTELGEVDVEALLARLVEDPHPGEARDQA